MRVSKIISNCNWFFVSTYEFPIKGNDISNYSGNNFYPCGLFFNGKAIVYLPEILYFRFLSHLPNTILYYNIRNFFFNLEAYAQAILDSPHADEKREGYFRFPFVMKSRIGGFDYEEDPYVLGDSYDFHIAPEFRKKSTYILHLKLLKNIKPYFFLLFYASALWARVQIGTATTKFNYLDINKHLFLRINELYSLLLFLYKGKILETYNSTYSDTDMDKEEMMDIYKKIIISITFFLFKRKKSLKIFPRILIIISYNIQIFVDHVEGEVHRIIEETKNKWDHLYLWERCYYILKEKYEKWIMGTILGRVILGNLKFTLLLFAKYNFHVSFAGYIFIAYLIRRIINSLWTFFVLLWQIPLGNFCKNDWEVFRNILVVPMHLTINLGGLSLIFGYLSQNYPQYQFLGVVIFSLGKEIIYKILSWTLGNKNWYWKIIRHIYLI